MAIRVELELEDGEFTSRILHAGDTLQDFERKVGQNVVAINKMNDAGQSALSTFRDISVVFGGLTLLWDKATSLAHGFVGEIVKVNAEMERLSTMLRGMSRAVDPIKDAADQMKYLRDFAQQAPFSLNALTSTFTQLKATGIDPMAGAMKGLVDAVAGVGGSEHVLKSAALAISEMSGKGVVEMKELRRQLGQAVPDAMELMARSMGVSMAKLAHETRSGTVQAKEALEGFWAEVERVHGNAAERMMETFVGQQQKMNTLWQNLQLRVGSNGFMTALRDQLMDLNRFLSGNMANNFADKMGAGLTQVVGALRRGIETIMDFRHEIVAVAEALAIGFGGQLAVNAISGLVGWFRKAGEELSYFRAQWAIAKSEIVLNNMMFASRNPLTEGLDGVKRSVAGVGVAAMNAGTMIGMLGSGLATVAPYLPIIAGGVVLAAEYFDLFGSKVKAAWQELEQFGATSRKQAQTVSDAYIDRLKTERMLIETPLGSGPDNPSLSDNSAALAAIDEKIAAAEEKKKKFLAQGTDSDADRKSERELARIHDELQRQQAIYDKAQREREIQQKKDEADLNEQHKSTAALDEKNKQASKELMIKVEEEKLRILDDSILAQRNLQVGADAETLAAAQKLEAALTKEWLQQNANAKKAREAVLDMHKSPKELDDKKLYDKGLEALNKLHAEVDGLKASLSGANADVVELQTRLSQGIYGDIGVDKVKELIANLIEAKRQQQELNELVASKKKLDDDINNATIRAQQASLEARTKGLSDFDKINIKFQEGGYPGLGGKQTDMQRQFLELATQMKSTEDAAKALGSTFSEYTFGGLAKSALEKFVDLSKTLASTWGNVKTSVSGLNFAGALTGASAQGPGVGATALSGFKDERDLGIRTLIGEAGHEIDEGLIGVANVIKNRVRSGDWGSTVKDVVTAPKQFSLWNAGNPAGDTARRTPEDSAMYQRAARIYDLVMSGAIGDPTQGALNYYNPRAANPDWGPGMRNRISIGNHDFGNPLPDYRPIYPNDAKLKPSDGLTPEEKMKMEAGIRSEQQAHADQADRAVKDAEEELSKEIVKWGSFAVDLKKARASLKAKITDGQADPSDTNPNSPRYKRAFELADDADAKREAAEKIQSNRRKADSAIEAEKKEEETRRQRQDELNKRLANPDSYYSSERYLSRNIQERTRRDDIQKGYAPGSDEYNAAEENYKRGHDENVRQDIEATAAKYAKENETAKSFFGTQEDLQSKATQHAIAQYQSELEAYRAAGGHKVEVEQAYQKKIALAREEALMKHPLVQQLAGYGDVFKNLEQDSTKWLSSFNDNLANAITHGKVNWKSFAQQILTDLAKIGLQLAESQLFKMLMGGLNLGGGGGLFSGFGRMFGVAHTGGILGETNLSQRYANPMIFAGAPRFHTGGIIGHDEVPIIARKGEGVFTEEQMAKMGGAYMHAPINVSIHAPVNATGGSTEQNADLAKQLSTHLETIARTTVVDEIRKQQRPGNLLNQ